MGGRGETVKYDEKRRSNRNEPGKKRANGIALTSSNNTNTKKRNKRKNGCKTQRKIKDSRRILQNGLKKGKGESGEGGE